MSFPTPVPTTPTTPGTTGGWGTEVNAYLAFLKSLALGRLRYAGDWAASTAYAQDEVVTYSGGLYAAKAAFTSGASFSATNWQTLMAPAAVNTDPPGYGLAYTFHPVAASANGSVGTANRGYFMRVQGSATCSAIKILVGATSGNIRVSVFSNTGTGKLAKPDTQKATSGTVACPAAGIQSVALTGSVTISHGDWIMLAADNTTATFARGSVIVSGNGADGLCWGMAGGMTAPGGSVSGSVFSGLNAYYAVSDA